MKKLYKVGIYCRLSVDDASNSAKAKNYIPADESVSIENQYELLSKFVMLNGWTEVKSYRDDGYSGGNFQRPGFLEMLEDARHGRNLGNHRRDVHRLPSQRQLARPRHCLMIPGGRRKTDHCSPS